MEAAARNRLKELLRSEEGLVLRAYDDKNGRIIAPGSYVHVQTREPIGYVTIGFGRNLYSRGITNTEAEGFLIGDTTDVCLDLDKHIPWWVTLDPARQVVLADMAFQMGAQKLLNQWPNFLAAIKAGQFGRAAIEMTHSRWFSQTPKRAHELITIMESGKL
jgi:lysozyme